MTETLADVLARTRRDRNRVMLEHARRGLQDLRAATWEAHHDLGVMIGAAHDEVVRAYSIIERELDKLATCSEYAPEGRP